MLKQKKRVTIPNRGVRGGALVPLICTRCSMQSAATACAVKAPTRPPSVFFLLVNTCMLCLRMGLGVTCARLTSTGVKG